MSVCLIVFNEKACLSSLHRHRQHLSEYSYTNEPVDHFSSVWLSSLHIITPVEVRKKSSKRMQPWINNSICSKTECRKAEHRWSKSGLQIHYNILTASLLHYNSVVKDARTHCFSELISAHQQSAGVKYHLYPLSATREFEPVLSSDLASTFRDSIIHGSVFGPFDLMPTEFLLKAMGSVGHTLFSVF